MRLKPENKGLANILKKCRFYIILRIDRYPLSIPSIPKFHYSIIPCGSFKQIALKSTTIPTICIKSDSLI
jgi:hypothetical protein